MEIDHGHHVTVLLFHFWRPWERARGSGEDAGDALSRLRDRLLAGPFLEHEHVVPPAWGTPEREDVLELGVAFKDVVAGTRAVTAIAEELDLSCRVRVFEAPGSGGDPLQFLRQLRRSLPGEHVVILWQPGADSATTSRRCAR